MSPELETKIALQVSRLKLLAAFTSLAFAIHSDGRVPSGLPGSPPRSPPLPPYAGDRAAAGPRRDQ
jgi:hypothetical protein